MSETSAPAVHFTTRLVPYRSLSPEGFKWLMRVAIGANLAIGLPLYYLGAWPVLGFMGLDVYLLWWLFQRNYLDARRSETLTLTDGQLIVDRISPDGEREQHRLDAYWLRLELQGEAERLLLISRGNRLVVGRFLAPAMREQVAEQLNAALAAYRSPRYHHQWDE
jgi:uncharacterized membrane protein